MNNVKQISLVLWLTGACFGVSFPSVAQTNLPQYQPIAIGVAASGGLNYTTVDGSSHIAAGLSFKPLLVTSLSVYVKHDYTPRQSLVTSVSYGGWGINYGGMGYHHFSMVSLSLAGRYYFQDASYRRRWFAEAGPVARFALIGSNVGHSSSFGRGYNNTFWTVNVKTRMQGPASPTLGAVGRVGFEQRISEQWQVGLSAFYHHGFQNLVENSFEAQLSRATPDPTIDPASFEVVHQGSLRLKGITWGLMLHVVAYPFPTKTRNR